MTASTANGRSGNTVPKAITCTIRKIGQYQRTHQAQVSVLRNGTKVMTSPKMAIPTPSVLIKVFSKVRTGSSKTIETEITAVIMLKHVKTTQPRMTCQFLFTYISLR